MALNEKRKKYLNDYTKANYKKYSFFLDYEKNADMIALLDAKKKKTEFIKDLIQAHMEKEKGLSNIK